MMSRANLVILTGASRGFGVDIARNVALAAKYARDTDYVLAARSADGLNTTAGIVRGALADAASCRVATAPTDLSKAASTDAVLAAVPQPLDAYKHVLLVHNVGTVGPLKHARDLVAVDYDNVMGVNLHVPMQLTSLVVRGAHADAKLQIVNVSSLLGLLAVPRFTLYCTTKASRLMAFRVLAEEDHPRVRVLNYSPGPMETEMRQEILSQMTEACAKSVELADRDVSARALVGLLDSDDVEIQKGKQVDYFDVHEAYKTM
eukprot:PhM_4_TR10475/c0_g1_i1/m.2107/K00072/SPR; sepiapterin reductase